MVYPTVEFLNPLSPLTSTRCLIFNTDREPSLEADIEALFQSTCKDGKVDHIVVTAGDALATTSIHESTLESIQRAGQVRFFAPLLIAKVGIKFLNPGPSSSIILTSGTVAERPIPNWSVVASYAAGLHGMTRNLALDLAPVRVNLVSPGAVDTELWKDMSEDRKAAMFKGIAAKVPTGHVGKSEFFVSVDQVKCADK